jgi:hypothetical protein
MHLALGRNGELENRAEVDGTGILGLVGCVRAGPHFALLAGRSLERDQRGLMLWPAPNAPACRLTPPGKGHHAHTPSTPPVVPSGGLWNARSTHAAADVAAMCPALAGLVALALAIVVVQRAGAVWRTLRRRAGRGRDQAWGTSGMAGGRGMHEWLDKRAQTLQA